METIYTLIIDPLRDMLSYVAGFIPTLISVLVVLTVGIYVSKLAKDIVDRLSKELRVDVIADKAGLSKALHKGGVKHKVSHLLGHFTYLVFIVSFIFMSVKIIGLEMMTNVLDRLFAYVPQVFLAVLVLVLGMVVAKFISTIVEAVARITDLPNPKLMERISRWVIVLYAATISLEELGYGSLLEGQTFHILFAGVVFAYALAFGLGGRDHASKYLEKR